MRRRTAICSALVLVGILAGCTTTLSDGTPTETPVSADELEADPGMEIAPGLTAGGVLDPYELADAHSGTVANRSFTWWERENRTGPGDDSSRGFVEGTVANETTYRYYRDTDDVRDLGFTDPVRNYSAYANGSHRFVRAFVEGTESGTVPIHRREAIEDNRSDLPLPSVGQYLQPVDHVSIEPVSIDGQRRYRIEDSVSATVLDGDTVRNYSLEAVVTPEGIVRTLTATYREGSTRVHYRFSLEGAGDVTVEKPAWLPAAKKS